MPRVIAICNMKGGVGKTTTAVNLGGYLAMLGKKTLLVDFDPQANASSALGFARDEGSSNVYDGILGKAAPIDLVKTSEVKNYHYIPAHPNLSGATVELLDKPNREHYLYKLLDPFRHLYEYILIDLPPSVSLLTINGLVAADEVLIPVQCEYYGLEGLGQLLETVDLINKNLGRNIKIAGALITMYDAREHLSREVSKEVRRKFGGHVYDVEIPRAVALAEAPSFSRPICLYAADSIGARAYERLAREVAAQEAAYYAPRFQQEVRVPVRLVQNTAAPSVADISLAPALTPVVQPPQSDVAAPDGAPQDDRPKILFEYL